jgi:hypothetical protein
MLAAKSGGANDAKVVNARDVLHRTAAWSRAKAKGWPAEHAWRAG